MRMSFLGIPGGGIPGGGIPRSGLLVRVGEDCVEEGGSAQASRKRVANVAKTCRVSTIRMLLMPAPFSSIDSFEGSACLRLQSLTLRRNVGGDGGPEVHLSRG